MVCDTENPNLRAASCCKVDVVKGAAGFLVAGFFSRLATLNCASTHFCKKACASSKLAKRDETSALNILPSALVNCATIL